MKKSYSLITSAIIGALIVGGVFIYRHYYPFFGGGYGGYHMGGGMGLMMPLFWILLIAAAVSLIGRTTSIPGGQHRPLSDGPDALEILKQRYAKGEIDKAEFRAKLADIRDT